MKLHSPQFERGLKRLVKATIRSSPELKREHRRVSRYRKHPYLKWLWRLAISVLLGTGVLAIEEKTGHLTTALAGIAIYLLLALCLRIQSLWTKLNAAPDTPALTNLPVNMADIFRWQLQKFFRESGYLLLDLAVVFGVLAWHHNFTFWQWLCVLGFVAVAWFNVLGLAALAVLRLPRAPFQLLSGGLMLLGIGLCFGREAFGPLALRLLDGSALVLNQLLPTAWALAPFELLNHSQRWWLLVLWLPVAFVVGHLRPWLSALRQGFVYRETLYPAVSDQVPGEESEPATRSDSPRQLGPTEIEGIIASGLFLNRPAQPLRHLPERILWSWLNPREQALAEFVYPAGLAIGAGWKKLYIVFLVMTGLVWVSGTFGATAQISALGLTAFVVFCMALARIANHGSAFNPITCSGVNVPRYATCGIGYQELGQFFLKCALVQLPFLFGLIMLLGGVAAGFLHQPVGLGLLFGFKVAGLMFASRFILIVFAFSSGTNDSSRFAVSSFLLLGVVVVLGVLFLLLGGAGLFVPDAVPALLLWAGALLVAWVFFWAYGWFYRFSRFDLMSLQSP